MDTYQEIVDYIYSKLPMFSRIGSDAIKNGFNNILALCKALDNPHQKGKFIHVAGTNGKGSVSHMLAAILQSQGYKTGLYTSPHLKDMRERVKINGENISEKEVIAFINKTQTSIETIQPSFFEITVAMAFDHFANHETDIAVIETGLGGRLDSTNIIQPQLSVITNIGYDHMQLLGHTLTLIAGEKAGIIKAGIPVVIGETQEEVTPIFIKSAAEKKAPIYFADQQFQVMGWQYLQEMLELEINRQGAIDHKKYLLDITGIYQQKNVITVLESCRQLNQQGITISEAAIEKGLQYIKKLSGLHGRWETIHQHPRIVLDVAHNAAGIQQLLNQLEITNYHQLHIVLGLVKDKDVATIISMLPKNAHYYFTNATIPRALPAALLQEKAALHQLQGNTFATVNIAIKEALAHAHMDDLILVCGSVFLVGEVISDF